MDEDYAATKWVTGEHDLPDHGDYAANMLAAVILMISAFALGMIVMALIWWAV